MGARNGFVAIAEAAFIADLNDRQIQRLADEHLVPGTLLGREGASRRFARLSAAFARFYVDHEGVLVAAARRQVVDELVRRVEASPGRDAILSLSGRRPAIDWKVHLLNVQVDFRPFLLRAAARARAVDQAGSRVSTDPEVMGGLPCFAGTRVPIENVLGSLDDGEDFAAVREAYPFLSEKDVAAARVHSQVHPRRGRPRTLAEQVPPLQRRSRRTERPARA